MAKSLVDMAIARRDAAKQRASELAAEHERIAARRAKADEEVRSWDDFIKRANELSGPAHASGSNGVAATGTIAVKKNSIPGIAAVAMRDANRPMSVKELAKVFIARGMGDDSKKFRNNINSALWRRKEDLFEKTEDGYGLRTTDFELVD